MESTCTTVKSNFIAIHSTLWTVIGGRNTAFNWTFCLNHRWTCWIGVLLSEGWYIFPLLPSALCLCGFLSCMPGLFVLKWPALLGKVLELSKFITIYGKGLRITKVNCECYNLLVTCSRFVALFILSGVFIQDLYEKYYFDAHAISRFPLSLLSVFRHIYLFIYFFIEWLKGDYCFNAYAFSSYNLTC